MYHPKKTLKWQTYIFHPKKYISKYEMADIHISTIFVLVNQQMRKFQQHKPKNNRRDIF
jgi:hypothetical protein